MNNLETILQEIYAIDPSLKSREEDIKKIILVLSNSKPNVAIDSTFMRDLKSRLETKAQTQPMESETKPTFNLHLLGGLVAAVFIVAVGVSLYHGAFPVQEPDLGGTPIAIRDDGTVLVQTDKGIETKKSDTGTVVSGFVRFESEDEYKTYLAQAEGKAGFGFGGEISTAFRVEEQALSAPSAADDTAQVPTRVSETNVQVRGIDEPDILKTDGKQIYFAPERRYYYGGGGGIRPLPAIEPSFREEIEIVDSELSVPTTILPPQDPNLPKTHIVTAFPPEALKKISEIENAGDLLLADDTLIIFENQAIYGYNVSNPNNPEKKWNVTLDSRNSIVQARLYDEKIYLITQTGANRSRPCPIPLFTAAESKVIIPCTDIYHPTVSVPVNVNYHITTIDPQDGTITKGISFVGSYNSTIYMSPAGVYVAYSYQGNTVKLILGLFKENTDIVPQNVIDRIANLEAYDISDQSKLNELQIIVQDFLNSLDEDEMLRVENELENRADGYFKKHKRELSLTDVVKIGVDDLKVKALGTIPGSLLNQFSLDEYQGNLRAATTVGGGFFFRFGGSREQENDVYVLDKNLSTIGSIKGLGIDERIFSARFIQDKGYLVTFRQIDPFFVLDLSDPKNPQVKGELKIPGYSSYLHPVTKDKIVGIGKEGSNVKISLFDVANPSNPTEAAKYMLDEYWSDVLNTHHAFLLDDKHNVFFMPGGRGGYVFSYTDDTLSLKKAVSGINARRALFIDDYLYIVGSDKIVVLDETNWERVKELTIK